MTRSQCGQAAVELVALAPLVCLLTLLAGTALLGGASRIAAEGAVARGLAAHAAGNDPVEAARAALPHGLVRHAAVQRAGPTLEVVIDLPGLAPTRVAKAYLPSTRRGPVEGVSSRRGP